MALFSSTQPSLRARILPRFPARVLAGTGITITKSGGAYTFAVTPSTIYFTTTTTVSSLPAAGTAGRRHFVTDATVTTFASVVSGGGVNKVPVYDDGTNWRVG